MWDECAGKKCELLLKENIEACQYQKILRKDDLSGVLWTYYNDNNSKTTAADPQKMRILAWALNHNVINHNIVFSANSHK